MCDVPFLLFISLFYSSIECTRTFNTMTYRIFTIPIEDSGVATAELNGFFLPSPLSKKVRSKPREARHRVYWILATRRCPAATHPCPAWHERRKDPPVATVRRGSCVPVPIEKDRLPAGGSGPIWSDHAGRRSFVACGGVGQFIRSRRVRAMAMPSSPSRHIARSISTAGHFP